MVECVCTGFTVKKLLLLLLFLLVVMFELLLEFMGGAIEFLARSIAAATDDCGSFGWLF